MPNLPTQRWLRRVQHSLRCHRQVSRVGNRDEVAKKPQFHLYSDAREALLPA